MTRPALKLLDELLERYATPALTDAGFRRSRGRRYQIGPPPGNTVFVQFRPYTFDPDVVGFYIEWAIIPTASVAFYVRDGGKAPPPSVTWGIVCNRVDVPPEAAAPLNVGAPSLWTFPVAGGVEPCGQALERLLTFGGLAAWWCELQDRELVLKRIDAGQLKSDLPPAVPRGRPWRHLAMYIDDGDPAQLDALLTQLEATHRDHPWVVWWRQRLDLRGGSTGLSGR